MSNNNDISKYQLLIIAAFFAVFIGITFAFINILTPFILGFIFAYLLEPIVFYLTKKRKFNKIIAITTVLLLFFTAFFLLFYYLIPVFLTQVSGFLTKLNVQYYFAKITGINYIANILKDRFPSFATVIESSLSDASTFFFKFSNQIFSNIINSGRFLLNLATILLITPILTFYFTIDMQKIKDCLKNLIPKNYKGEVLQIIDDINSTLSKYLKGQLTVSMILGVYYSIAFLALGIDYAIVLGIFSGISLFVPYLGIAFSFILVSIFGFVEFKTLEILLYLAAVYTCGNVMEGVFITPKLIGKSLNLHPLWIILGLLLGGSLLGFFGILFAIPLTAIVAVFIRFIVRVYKKSKLYKY
jgi:predicted PurR-regulated permease PerM